MSELTKLAEELVVLRRKVREYEDLLKRIIDVWDSDSYRDLLDDYRTVNDGDGYLVSVSAPPKGDPLRNVMDEAKASLAEVKNG